MKFCISIADLNIIIRTLYTQVFKLCDAYICKEKEADFSVIITESDLLNETKKQSIPIQAANSEMLAYLETLSVYRKIADHVIDHDTFLMHGSVVAVNNEAFMITAPSGTGKTTRTRFWLNQIEHSYVVNGDKPLIKIADDTVYACGTPWCGKENLGTNAIVPLKAIFFLERAEENEIEEISFSKAFARLLQQTYQPESSEQLIKTLHLLKRLDGKVRFFNYKSNLEENSVLQAYKAAGSYFHEK